MGPHTDVFVASVNEVRLDSFVVSVVRVDQYPNNVWGQKLHLDWVAIEYATATNFPEAGPPMPPQMSSQMPSLVEAFIRSMLPNAKRRSVEEDGIESNGEVAQQEYQIE